MSAPTTVAAVLTAHGEGELATAACQSMSDAIAHARNAGLTVDGAAILDRADAATRSAVSAWAETAGWTLCETDYGDVGCARNHAAEHLAATHLAFLDADDLWSTNWLTAAAAIAAEPEPDGASGVIVHPEFNWIFGADATLYVHIDQRDPAFDPAFLRFANYWDSLAFVPRRTILEVPYQARDLANGWAYEDWNWNCRTLEHGWRHHVAPGTIHFKRRRAGSQTLIARGQNALPRPSRLMRFAEQPPK